MQALKERGGRRTASRQAIVQALADRGSHATASDIAEAVQEQFPFVNMSTIYRTLDALEQIGVLEHVHLGHGKAVYHLADEDHQHLVCQSCGTVAELSAEKLEPFIRQIERDLAFDVDRRHFAIVGTCRRCRRKPATSR